MEDLMIETIKINGVDVYYIPNINESARDLIYGEDPLKKFTAAYPLELYITNVDGYEGEREFFSKFGLEIRNNMSVIVSKRSFARWVPQTYVRPREGDLIYVPFFSQTGEMYEIKYVNYSEAFYVLGNKYPYFYKLELEKLLGTFGNNAIITGANSGATFSVNVIPDELEDPQLREMYDNRQIQTEADDIVDLSESNPFGTPT